MDKNEQNNNSNEQKPNQETQQKPNHETDQSEKADSKEKSISENQNSISANPPQPDSTENNSSTTINQPIINPGFSNQPFINLETNLLKKIQQKGTRARLCDIAASNNQLFYQSNMNMVNNLMNPNLNLSMMQSLTPPNNPNFNPSVFSPAQINNPPPQVPPKSSSPNRSSPTIRSPPPKKEKIKEKKEKNLKKINNNKEKKEKTKKFYKNNKNKNRRDSDSDNDDKEWTRNPRHNNSTGSERSVRRNAEIHQQNSGNPRDIWVVSAPLFKQIPTVSEIEEVCGSLDRDAGAIETPGDAPENNDEDHFLNEDKKEKHWSFWMKDAVINTLNSSSKNSKNAQNSSSLLKSPNYEDADSYYYDSYNFPQKKKDFSEYMAKIHPEILFPPGPTPNYSDISSFWNETSEEFPVTDLQVQNYSILHTLLSAFVAAEPDKNHDKLVEETMMTEYESPFLLKKEEKAAQVNETRPTESENRQIECQSGEGQLSENKPIEGQSSESQLSENRPIAGQSGESQLSENRQIEGQSSEGQLSENRPIEGQSGESQLSENRSIECQSSECQLIENEPVENRKKVFLPSHVPVPQLEFNDYLSHTFEEKLEIELRGAGIVRPSQQSSLSNSLMQEFEKYQSELSKLQPQIDLIKDEVIRNLPEYEAQRSKRVAELSRYNDLMPKKSHKK